VVVLVEGGKGNLKKDVEQMIEDDLNCEIRRKVNDEVENYRYRKKSTYLHYTYPIDVYGLNQAECIANNSPHQCHVAVVEVA
jgi:hypothetical protein